MELFQIQTVRCFQAQRVQLYPSICQANYSIWEARTLRYFPSLSKDGLFFPFEIFKTLFQTLRFHFVEGLLVSLQRSWRRDRGDRGDVPDVAAQRCLRGLRAFAATGATGGGGNPSHRRSEAKRSEEVGRKLSFFSFRGRVKVCFMFHIVFFEGFIVAKPLWRTPLGWWEHVSKVCCWCHWDN